MTHFKLVRSSEMYESSAHEDNGVSIGDTEVYLASHVVSNYIVAEGLGAKFVANSHRHSTLFWKFCRHTDTGPEYVSFKRGASGRMYCEAVSF